MRKRVFTIGAFKDVDLSWLHGKLSDVKERPVHHAFAFFDSNESSDGADPMEVDPVKEANYATCFKTAYEKAVLAKRVDKGAQVPDVRRRFCALNAAEPFVKSASPWLKSQLDVCLGLTCVVCLALLQCACFTDKVSHHHPGQHGPWDPWPVLLPGGRRVANCRKR